MWNKHPVVRQEKLHREAEDHAVDAVISKNLKEGRIFLGTRQDVKRATGKLPVTGEKLSDE